VLETATARYPEQAVALLLQYPHAALRAIGVRMLVRAAPEPASV
jgi:hypothetical protein